MHRNCNKVGASVENCKVLHVLKIQHILIEKNILTLNGNCKESCADVVWIIKMKEIKEKHYRKIETVDRNFIVV